MNSKALSPAIVVILMYATTVILALTLAAFVLDTGEQPLSPNEQWVLTEPINPTITVSSVHYNQGFAVPCMVLTDTGETYGVDLQSDCMKLEDSKAKNKTITVFLSPSALHIVGVEY